MFGLGDIVKGGVGGVVEPVADVLKEKEKTKQVHAEALAETKIASAAWRPALAVALKWSMIAYVIGTFVLTMLIFTGIWLEAEWADIANDESALYYLLEFWKELGKHIFGFSALYLTTYAGGRSAEKMAGALSGKAGGIVGNVAGLITGNKPATVERESQIHDADAEQFEAIEGVEVRQRTKPEPTPEKISFASVVAQKVRTGKNYFSDAELECKGQQCNCAMPPFSKATLNIANDAREQLGKLFVNSGFRCPEHNKAVGGAKGSYHVKARAMDLRPTQATPAQMYDYLCEKYPNQYGFGLYKNFVHIDDRGDGYFARKAGPDKPWRKFKVPDLLV